LGIDAPVSVIRYGNGDGWSYGLHVPGLLRAAIKDQAILEQPVIIVPINPTLFKKEMKIPLIKWVLHTN
jgi:hypothetical protein